jgi:hypothetical protein
MMPNINSNVNDSPSVYRLLESSGAWLNNEGRALLPGQKANSSHIVGAIWVQRPCNEELLKIMG